MKKMMKTSNAISNRNHKNLKNKFKDKETKNPALVDGTLSSQ